MGLEPSWLDALNASEDHGVLGPLADHLDEEGGSLAAAVRWVWRHERWPCRKTIFGPGWGWAEGHDRVHNYPWHLPQEIIAIDPELVERVFHSKWVAVLRLAFAVAKLSESKGGADVASFPRPTAFLD